VADVGCIEIIGGASRVNIPANRQRNVTEDVLRIFGDTCLADHGLEVAEWRGGITLGVNINNPRWVVALNAYQDAAMPGEVTAMETAVDLGRGDQARNESADDDTWEYRRLAADPNEAEGLIIAKASIFPDRMEYTARAIAALAVPQPHVSVPRIVLASHYHLLETVALYQVWKQGVEGNADPVNAAQYAMAHTPVV
jgi:hypothetical protein